MAILPLSRLDWPFIGGIPAQMSVIVASARSTHAMLAAALLLVCMALWSGVASAQSAAPEPAPLAESATSLLPKTILYAGVASLMDVAIGTVVTGDVVTGTGLAVVASASGWLLFQVHEMAWAALAPNEQASENLMLTKTATFTAVNAIRLFSVGMLFTQNVVASLSFVALDAVGDAGSYVVTDRIWAYFVPSSVAAAPTKSGS